MVVLECLHTLHPHCCYGAFAQLGECPECFRVKEQPGNTMVLDTGRDVDRTRALVLQIVDRLHAHAHAHARSEHPEYARVSTATATATAKATASRLFSAAQRALAASTSVFSRTGRARALITSRPAPAFDKLVAEDVARIATLRKDGVTIVDWFDAGYTCEQLARTGALFDDLLFMGLAQVHIGTRNGRFIPLSALVSMFKMARSQVAQIPGLSPVSIAELAPADPAELRTAGITYPLLKALGFVALTHIPLFPRYSPVQWVETIGVPFRDIGPPAILPVHYPALGWTSALVAAAAIASAEHTSKSSAKPVPRATQVTQTTRPGKPAFY